MCYNIIGVEFLKKFNVTFKENTKYKPMTRKIMVETKNINTAENIIISEFGSWGKNKNGVRVPSDRIEIIKTEEIKEEAN